MVSTVYRQRILQSPWTWHFPNLSRRVTIMAHNSEPGEPSRKRPRLEDHDRPTNHRDFYRSLTSSVSPPPLRRPKTMTAPKIIPSPFQLTSIQDLPPSSNVDAVSLKEILGDPLIAECWEFNYLHNLDFLMEAFDNDIRELVKVHVVHGFWKNEDPQRLHLKVEVILKTCEARLIIDCLIDRNKPGNIRI
jgi:hypothetical protein